MPDIFTKTKRSEVMSRVRSSGNKDTELRLITIFRAHRITGWRRNFKLPGKPDFVFPAHRLAVFVDGCYWHGCPVHYRRPKSNRKFWDAKIARNRQRDREVNRLLKARGWRVFRVWEHALTRKNETRTVARITRAIDG
ncbi:DNA mismatch endonuclease (patch repair protein) [Ereboglobus sp. PH5-5]|uniref:very short patch repair endonuclease n=1 Tax=Ereboglobus sp. PH5-5 TaxID=2940529 RepID=UPI0024062023|nr:very short patch repair endonuclease [Ereboglobus sp. PH5-5]MDF9832406.1 DNA mismatch endonuclease (patch repair protein) [Ereboglobus sp. PH5-5]